MRWLVDVTSLAKGEKESIVVDAESWQKALQAARSKRGESAPMSGFSIELLDNGCRAVDPVSRLRYEVRKEDAPESKSSPSRRPSVPGSASKKSQSAGTRTVMMGVAPAALEGAGAPATSPTPSSARQPVVPAIAPAQAVPKLDASSGVAWQIIFKREQDATESLPLTYREYVFLVAPGTTEAAAETLLLTQVEMIRSSLHRVAPGKLVNLGVFDVPFQGRPPVPPLATLAWKDWRGAPVVTYPRRANPAPPLTNAPVAVASPAVVTPASGHASPPLASAHPPGPAPLPLAPITATLPPPDPVTGPLPSTPIALPLPSTPATPASVTSAPMPPASRVAPTLVVNAEPAEPVSSPPVTTPAMAPPPPLVPDPVFVLPPSSSRPPSVPPAPAPSPRARVRGEDLIADLFEAMHDLHFVRDALEGGEFCLALAMEKLPSQAGLVHLYDIDRREFVVSSTRGAGTSKLRLKRHAESDAILMAAMRKRRALVVANGADAAGIERYSALGEAQSLLIAPVILHGRFLGAIELVNPLDGQPFNDSEGNALSYIAEQFAEFISSHGIVTDPVRISQRPPPEA